ncbi:MAG: YdcF family protein, partial [Anaerolineaceae bacterium]|nr:YdcF family protein [Anaerolineaceae bacterium]
MVANMEKKRNRQQGCLGILGGALGLTIILLLASFFGYFLLRTAGAYLIIADELVPADAIVIMSGGGEGRMKEALEIYKDNYAHLIILTETGESVGGFDYLQSFDLRIQLLNNGVPSGNILITESEVSSTFDEAKAIKQLLERRQLSSAIIVTDPYHTKRTSIIFDEIFKDSNIKLIFRPVTPSW